VEVLDRTASTREMYKTVLGDKMGELDAATRRICGFGEVPDGLFCHDSLPWFGERAKLGVRKVSTGLERGMFCVGLSGVAFTSIALSDVFGRLEGFAVLLTAIPSRT